MSEGGEPRAHRAVVAGHGDFAAGLVSAVVQITGRDDVYIPVSNRGLSAQDVERAHVHVEVHRALRAVERAAVGGEQRVPARGHGRIEHAQPPREARHELDQRHVRGHADVEPPALALHGDPQQ